MRTLNNFRALLSDHNEPIVNNFRPPQPLNNRKVLVAAQSAGDSAAMKKMGLVLYFMTSMAVLMMSM
ncbi:putative Eukaryotic-type carbonic anhydrase-containing protein [Homarus americanus]|uniref:Putative Eukaryotic-type carbonic anhydrase-containing protein n=1 Tax=Homarus americanus TaxID=6706 RepID=A0A8J5MSA3_HOMAM|nr:putative Eukaryotic-type carbonic anhydrase-containing protein [Homarus americanus]